MSHVNTVAVRLTRKLAGLLDGIDVTPHAVGDVIYVSPYEAGLLVAEGWAEPVVEHKSQQGAQTPLALAADKTNR